MEIDNAVKVDTKYCINCNHHYQDHFTDNRKYPQLRRCVLGCGMPLCCYSGCRCGEYSPIIKSVPYDSAEQGQQCYYCPKVFIQADKFIDHLDWHYNIAHAIDPRLPYQRIKRTEPIEYVKSRIPGIPVESWHGRVSDKV